MFALPLSNRGIMAHTVKYVYVFMKLSTRLQRIMISINTATIKIILMQILHRLGRKKL
jgi:hypothetical protein